MERLIPPKNSRSFLEKFEGKKNAISRQGLLHLLDIKKQSFEDNKNLYQIRKMPSREPKNQAAPSGSEKLIEERTSKAKSSRGTANNSVVMHQLNERYMKMREELQQPKSVELGSNKLKLPAINKSSSHANSIRKKNIETSAAELAEVTASQRVRSLPRRTENGDSAMLNNLTKKIELDKYALRHLQFLDKFEKQMIQNEGIPKKTSRSEYH